VDKKAGVETAFFTVNTLDFRIRHELDVGMPTRGNQFRGDDSHGAVVGGKGLVQLGHHPANTRFPVNEIDLESGFCEIEGSLHPADSGSDDHHRSHFFTVLFRHLSPQRYAVTITLSRGTL
jgi:hypothetical protein